MRIFRRDFGLDREEAIGSSEPQLDARASVKSYVILTLVWIVLAVVGGVEMFSGRTTSRFQFYVPLIVTVYFALWLAVFRLQVANGMLTYRELFRKTRSIALTDIARVQRRYGRGRSFAFHLMIYPRAAAESDSFAINMRVFSDQDVRSLFEILAPVIHKEKSQGLPTGQLGLGR